MPGPHGSIRGEATISSARVERCMACGGPGAELYSGLHDRLFDAAGSWRLVRCENTPCGLFWLDPMPTPEDIHKAYRNYFTHDAAPARTGLRSMYHWMRLGYLAKRYGYGDATTPVWQRLLGSVAGLLPSIRAGFDFNARWLRARTGGKLLEMGCGRGEALGLFTELGWDAEGLDPDAAAIRVARERGLRVKPGSLYEQAYAPGSFDAITMSHVIEHLHDPVDVVKECRRILKPGGVMVALTPNTAGLGHRLYRGDWLHLDPPRHLHLFNARNLRKIFLDAGFMEVSCFTVIRDADWTLGASAQIRQHGHYDMGKLPMRLRLSGLVMMYVEWTAMLLSPQLGEEIVAIARKE
jgi:SAM-dependent methyltransferase